MAQTVTECLLAGTDSVTVIDDIKANGSSSIYALGCTNQAEINECVQRNVDHLEIILAYAPVDSDDDTPNVAGAASSKKTTHVAAVTTGTDYIAAN
tara:strand:- start:1 stop:288 length:288 start_codon:yes stop_codon:yes gene_type:complete